MSKEKGMQVHHIRSVEGQVTLTLQKLTPETLAQAIVAYQKAENIKIGTSIGVNEQGYFFSDDLDWHPAKPGAFDNLNFIPWVHIHELLRNVPEGTTEDYLKSGCINN